MTRPLRARIDLDAVRRNARLARELAPDSRLLAVVKADAYGHGAVPVARALAHDADAFAVASLEEAATLRAARLDHPLLLLEGPFVEDELEEANRLGLDLVIHARHQLEWLDRAGSRIPRRVWLKVDTGMHRLGFPPAELAAVHRRLRALDPAPEIVLTTHFARADEPGDAATAAQIRAFETATAALEGSRSLANSAATLAWPASHGDWIRPGILLYGCDPLARPNEASRRLRPAMELASAVIAVRELAPGEAVGYGGRFVCDRPTRIGVVAAGYGDGYPRHAPDGTPVHVSGHRARLVGRVSMDMMTVDLTGIPDAGVGAPVELWGGDLPANEVAHAVGTIAYELVTRVGPRVPREYL